MADDPKDWELATRLVRGGMSRSAFGETAEALYLTQGFVYDSAEAADARFAGTEPGFVYSRYANPTNDMFEKRMCLMEGAEDARATASGMAAMSSALLCFFLLFVLFGRERKRILVPCLALTLILGTVGLVGWEPVFDRFEAVRTTSGELNTKRTDYWMDSLQNISDYPLFGTGFGTFADVYPRVQSVTTRKLVNHAHNDFVELAVLCFLLSFSAFSKLIFARCVIALLLKELKIGMFKLTPNIEEPNHF